MGSLQPNSVPFRGHFPHPVVPNFLCHRHMQDGQGERESDGYGDLCLSCTIHLSALRKAGKLFDIAESSTIKEASSTGKVRKNLSL